MGTPFISFISDVLGLLRYDSRSRLLKKERLYSTSVKVTTTNGVTDHAANVRSKFEQQVYRREYTNHHTNPRMSSKMRTPTISITSDVFRPWFQEVWMPLTMGKRSNQGPNNRPSQLTRPTISVTSDVLEGVDTIDHVTNIQLKTDNGHMLVHIPTMSITSDVLGFFKI